MSTTVDSGAHCLDDLMVFSCRCLRMGSRRSAVRRCERCWSGGRRFFCMADVRNEHRPLPEDLDGAS